jgi:hypothetical protein
VFAGHLAAREFDESPASGTPFKVERVEVGQLGRILTTDKHR